MKTHFIKNFNRNLSTANFFMSGKFWYTNFVKIERILLHTILAN